MVYDIDRLDAAHSYKLLTGTLVPRPIAWVVTRNAEGRVNAAPFSFFNGLGGHPPAIGLGIGPRGRGDKDTLANLRGHGLFVVNLVPEELAAAMNETATDFPSEIDELEAVGIATAPSLKVDVPRIADSPVAYECRVRDIHPLDGGQHLVVGTVLAIYVRDDALLDAGRCHVDAAALNLVGRMQSPGGYVRTRDTFRMKQLDYAGWRAMRGMPDDASGR